MAALNKVQMANYLHEQLGINRREGKIFVELFFSEIANALISGEQVKLSGFGNFDLRDKPERPGRNPRTKEPVLVSARRVVTFRPGQRLRAWVDAYARKQLSGQGESDSSV